MKKQALLICTLLIIQWAFIEKAFSQNVSINSTGAAADVSAMLDIASTSKGLLIPRMTFGQRNTILAPAESLVVYQTDGTRGFYYYTADSGWLPLVSTSQWTTLGSNIYFNSGNVGIGTTLPLTKLHIVGTNPLTLTGVQESTSPISDSILTIAYGAVKKIPVSSLASSTNWSLTGNSSTSLSTHFLGTTDLKSLRFRTNNIQGLLLDSAGNLSVGNAPVQTAGSNMEKFLVDAGSTVTNPTTTTNVITGKGYINNYLQLNIQNKHNGASASSDVVATADNGDELTNYVDLGINSSGNTDNFFGAANDAYLYNMGQNFYIGTGTATKSLAFVTGGTNQSTYERMRIDGSGNVGIGIQAPEQLLHTRKYTGTTSTPQVVTLLETKNSTNNSYSAPPVVSLSREVASSQFASNVAWVGPSINFSLRNPGNSPTPLTQLSSFSSGSAARFSFYTRTGMVNANPGTGTLAENMTLSGNVLHVGNLDGGPTLLSVDANGNIIRSASDARLKTNVVKVNNALSKVLALRGVNFSWKDKARFGKQRELGFIAQELEKVVPEVVSSGGEYKSVNYAVLTALLTEAIKEQQTTIDTFKNQLDEQNERLKRLEEKLGK